MRNWIRAFFMAWGMFLAIPCPSPKWDGDQRDRMLVCLPLIGLLIGGTWALALFVVVKIGLNAAAAAAVLAAVPWLLSGFIHLDGFMDVSDAVLSRRDLETRQKILKDPHCGAFAVISLALLILFSFAVFRSWGYAIEAGRLVSLALIPFVSRACAGIAVLAMKPMAASQYDRERDKRLIIPLAVMLAAGVTVPAAVFGLGGLAPLAAALVYWGAALLGAKQLGGMSGDISGFALSLGELAGAAVLVFVR